MVKKLYYYEIPKESINEGFYRVTTFNYEGAKEQYEYRVANFADLNDDGCDGYWYKDQLIEIQEGIYKYYEEWDIVDEVFNTYGIINFGYREATEGEILEESLIDK